MILVSAGLAAKFASFPSASGLRSPSRGFYKITKTLRTKLLTSLVRAATNYIWGGPYDASEEIGSEFAGILTDADIELAVDQVQTDGTFDWAPNRSGDEYKLEDDRLQDEHLKHLALEQRRKEVLSTLGELRQAIAELDSGYPGLGHNNPPEFVSNNNSVHVHVQELHIHVDNLTQNFSSEAPDKSEIETNSSYFKIALSKLIELAKKAAEKKAELAIAGIATYVVEKAGVLSFVIDAAQKVLKAIDGWLTLLNIT